MSQRILDQTAALFDLTLDELRGPSRQRHIAEARHAAAWVLRRRTSMSLHAVAVALGRRDHTTTLHAVAAAEQLAAIDPLYARRLRALVVGR